jgi:small conductance mechanosensitive channel
MSIPDDFGSTLFLFLLHLGLAVVVMLLGRWLAQFARARMVVVLQQTKLTDSLKQLSVRLTYWLVLLAAFLLALAVAGVPTTALITTAGVVIIILGIALQESLSDFASAIIFSLFPSFKVGDLIETNGVLGRVQEAQLFSTVLLRADNKVITIPNSNIRKNNLINHTQLPVLRVDMEVLISYESDLAKAKRVLQDLLAADERVLADPPPMLIVLELEDNGVKLGVRPFVKTDDYWWVLWDTLERIKLRFDKEGIIIPYPQRQLHFSTTDLLFAAKREAERPDASEGKRE